MIDAPTALDRLKHREIIPVNTTLLVAHPDDETIGVAASLSQFGLLTLAQFSPDREPLRLAPAYNLRVPPHATPLLYQSVGWHLTGARWLAQAVGALLGLAL